MISSLTQITQTPLINLRWLSVIAMLAAAMISPSIIGSSELMPRLLAFATLIASINACMHLAILLSRSFREDLPFFSPFTQLAFDLASWGTYVYLSGGATNPLISVFLPLVAIGAFILSKAQAWLFGGAAIVAYTFLWRYYQPLAIADAEMATRLHLLGMWLVFVVSAIVLVGFVLQMTQAIHERDVELAKAREQAIRDDWLISMGSLAAGAAHELSTPLGTMNILIDDWLDDPALPAPQRAEYELMRAQIDTCKQALNHLTNRAGNPRSGRLGKMHFVTWLNATLAAWSTLNPTANLTVDTAGTPATCLLSVDPSLDRTLSNLLDNALFAGASRIELKAHDNKGRLTIDIDDNGSGISAAALQSFNDAQPIVSASGMGIGLLLSRTAIERLGGKLTLARRPEGGTRASLNLPRIDDEEKTTA